MDYYEFFRELLPLHEKRIEERIKELGVDLNEFLDFTQSQLNKSKIQRPAALYFYEMGETISSDQVLISPSGIGDTKRIQGVILQMLENPTNKIKAKGFATYLFHKTGFIAPAKNNIEGWKDVMKNYPEFKFTPSTIGKSYNDISKEENRIDPESNKNLMDALKVFEKYQDDEGVKKLKAEIRKQKKGSAPG